MFRIAPDFSNWTLAAGEPVAFDLLLCDKGGTALPIDPSQIFVATRYTPNRAFVKSYRADFFTDDDGTWLRFIMDGDDSERSFFRTGLLFEIAERLDNGKDILESGTITVKMSAPNVQDYDAAPLARNIIKVKRKFDPSTMNSPTYEWDTIPYKASISNSQPYTMDFSSNTGSQYIALF